MKLDRGERELKLTMLVIVETRTDAHSLRSQVGIGSAPDLLVRTVRQNLEYFRFRSWCKRGEIRCCSRRGDGECADDVVGYGRGRLDKNSSGDEIANVNFLRRYGTYVLQNTKKREPISFNH